ncbi:hypothetical protein HYX02_02460 [Candidatus Woesearchaeota archaeon]|nr:hypothetical protein [Candidatus Woesearchaeota archaeon]
MKRGIFFIVVFVLAIPVAIAESQIFSGKVLTDTDKIIEGGIFRFNYDINNDKVFVQTPSTGLIVDNGACKSNNIFKICINKANFSYRNSTTWVYYYDVDATIYKLTGSLSPTSKAGSTTLLQNEQTEFSIIITNPTDFEITGIDYRQDLSPFIIAQVKGCSLDGTQISWQGSLKSKFDKTCTAIIIAEKDGTFSLSGNLTYFNGYETEKKTTDTLTVKVLPDQLKIGRIVDNYTEAKKPFYMNMSLQNINKEEKMGSSITIELPNNMVLLENIEGFDKEFNTLKHNIILEPDSYFNYTMYLEASSESKAPIKQKFVYSLKGIQDVTENETFVNATEPKPVINFSTYNPEITPGEKFVVIAKIQNPSRFNEITDIQAKLTAPYSNEVVERLNKLKPNETYAIISNTLALPSDALFDKTIKLELCIEYKFFGVLKSINKTLEIKIKSTSEAIKPIDETKANTTAKNEPLELNKTEQTIATQAPDNKTSEEPQAQQLESQAKRPDLVNIDFLNKSNIRIIVAVLAIILLVPAIIVAIRKRKKESAMEQLKEELKPPPKQ